MSGGIGRVDNVILNVYANFQKESKQDNPPRQMALAPRPSNFGRRSRFAPPLDAGNRRLVQIGSFLFSHPQNSWTYWISVGRQASRRFAVSSMRQK
jgi:hypothetical protein